MNLLLKFSIFFLATIVLQSNINATPFSLYDRNFFHAPDTTKKEETKKQMPTSLEEREEKYIDEALKAMELDRTSPGFPKDKVDDAYRLEIVQRSLYYPLELPSQCDSLDDKWGKAGKITEALKLQAEVLGKWWRLNGEYKSNNNKASEINGIINKAPKEFQPILHPLLSSVYEADELLKKAFKDLPLDERKYIIKEIIPTLMLKEDIFKDDFQIEAEKVEMNLAGDDTIPDIITRDTIYPEQRKIQELTLKIKYEYLHHAGLIVASAVDNAIAILKTMDVSSFDSSKGNILFQAETPFGSIIIGGTSENLYKEDALIIIDMGGNDRYLNRAGGAISLNGAPASVVIDVSGDDFYSSKKKFSQGSGLFGIGILADLEGNDSYSAGLFAQGGGLFGIGILWDEGKGEDDFSGDTFCQGAGGWGVGTLYNQSGDTKYYAKSLAQGMGYTLGVGAIIDKEGHDYYIAAGTEMNNRYYSLSQGFGQGNRPIASGGIGILIDKVGNDHYSSFYYAQACSYWYGLGILLDSDGSDRYDATVYAQGCGIHLSTGVLIDRGGSDFYNCTYGGNAQGAAHDLSVGILVDKKGNDTYVGMGNNQGSAITNAFALFIDSQGKDIYYTSPMGGQGYGGKARNYGSIGVFLDLGGDDFYSEKIHSPDSGTKNNNTWLKGDKGVGIDVEKE